MKADQLATLADCPWVEFVDVPNRRARAESLIPSSDLTLNTLSAVWYQFPELTGAGLTASIKEEAFDTTDLDLRGRALPFSLEGRFVSRHATEMATMMAGAGNTGPQGRGAARAARLSSSDFANLLPDELAGLRADNVSVQNHSYGVGVESYYGLEAKAYDEQARELPSLLHVFSSGNSGDQTPTDGPYAGLAGVANLTGQFKQSKNTLSVGATNGISELTPRSSRGPAYDGRLKPELVAYGAGGTSDAAALVSGASLLVQQAYREQYAGQLPSSALVKAVLINSSDDVDAVGPDFRTGYGQLDALGAVQTVQAKSLFSGSAGQATSSTFTLNVPAGTSQLKCTLAWLDPAAAANATQALLNDLDLELVETATGKKWRPWVLSTTPRLDSLNVLARRGADHLNNVEQITLAAPPAGQYQVLVRGYAVPDGPQEFHLAYELEPSFRWTWPVQGSQVEAGQPAYVRWQWLGSATPATLQYRYEGATTWNTVATNINLQQRSYAWAPPDTAAHIYLRLQAGNLTMPTKPFIISPEVKARTVYYCAPEALLAWPAQPGVIDYQLYTLRGPYLQPWRVVSDTTLLLSDTDAPGPYLAVAPLVQGKPGLHSQLLNYQQGSSCYFISFLPSQLVAPQQIDFDVLLASTYQLVSATLERQDASGQYVALQTLSPVTQTQFHFTDASPNQGSSLYRVRLITTSGQSFFSQPERVYSLAEGDLAVFPNPVQVGQVLKVAASDAAPLHLWLYDGVGKLQREITADGVINELNTHGLKPGHYILRIETDNGRHWNRHLSIF
ncbi:S8 family serine peptidase [Hymenobacter sp. BT730]|uniref:S8 family serine peptidase n=1 Tax=Hymenobacter sp. BT730 TaxID=3063332 RepID=UPI0026E03A70|nr:S8 family serine peptidase [Hymenobacter sp. BT730]